MAAQLTREVLIDVLKHAGQMLGNRPGDVHEPGDALAKACHELGVDAKAFDEAISRDVDLEVLKTNILREAIAGSTDPGPHAEISRESPSGQPGDTTKNRSEPEPPREHGQPE